MPMQGELFTWHNCSYDARSLWKRLDRMLCNDVWLEMWPDSMYRSLTPRTSDHSPLVLTGSPSLPRASMFCFDNYLAQSTGFIQTVHVWRHNIVGTRMEETNVRESSFVKWPGDVHLSAFFQIHNDGGTTITEPTEVTQEFVSFYQRLLGGDRENRFIDLSYLRPWAYLLSEEDSDALTALVTATDVKMAFFDIPKDKSPSPDGYSSGFFKTAWPIVGDEVTRAVLDFFHNGKLLRQVNATLLVLIPKVQAPTHVTDIISSTYRQEDLLLFCKAEVTSVGFFKQGLETFALMLGLHANPNKSQMIVSKSAAHLRDDLLGILDFREGCLPLRYLGRVQLIQSVLMALNTYWAMAFILPKGVIREVEKRLRTFLWKAYSGGGYAKVAWSHVCRPKEEGGLGIRNVLALNRALMSKHLWRVITSDRNSIWVEWVTTIRLRSQSIWTVSDRVGSWSWRNLLRLRLLLLPHIEYRIGNSELFSIWQDPWHPNGILIHHLPRGPSLMDLSTSDRLCKVIHEGQWQWPVTTDIDYLTILHPLPAIHGDTYKIIWLLDGGNFSTTGAYTVFSPPEPKVDWSSLLLGQFKIPRHNFILCSHLFFKCPFAQECLRAVRRRTRFPWPNREWNMDISWAAVKWRGRHVVNMAYRAFLASLVYQLWEERNHRVFQQWCRSSSSLGTLVVEDVRQRIISVALPLSVSTFALYRQWRIPWPVKGIRLQGGGIFLECQDPLSSFSIFFLMLPKDFILQLMNPMRQDSKLPSTAEESPPKHRDHASETTFSQSPDLSHMSSRRHTFCFLCELPFIGVGLVSRTSSEWSEPRQVDGERKH
ncbi:UNVERIFIED_CONTAM: hypothetical protein Slati_1676800 [Sesamum latifolium]|uniref:Reverse transcriptase zinc-binding domain-containing protein n=1 Tax=Sesamum latifolium TaxID=2727402 RepID=A0AAW2WTW2_9LAMI